MPKKNTVDDVWNFIDTRNGDTSVCWPWIGALSGKQRDRGYISIDGQKQLAHRVVYELVNGPIPDGLVIRHMCNNGTCCNPTHLVAGTRGENEQDKVKTDQVGLPVHVVREIRDLLKNDRITQDAIAKYVSHKHNVSVSRSTVRNIKLGFRRTENEIASDELVEMPIEEVKKKLI